MSAVTSTGRVVSVCSGACTAETTRSGRSIDRVDASTMYVRGGVPVWISALVVMRSPRSRLSSATCATPSGAGTSLRFRTRPVTPVSVYVLTSTCLTVVTAPQPGAVVKVRVRSVRTDPVNAFAVIAYGAAVELGHAVEAAPRAFDDAVPRATTTATASAPTIAPFRVDARCIRCMGPPSPAAIRTRERSALPSSVPQVRRRVRRGPARASPPPSTHRPGKCIGGFPGESERPRLRGLSE
jgi:hypothetical protein